MIETAAMLSVLSVVSLGGLELARYTLLHQKMEHIAASIGDLVAQGEFINEGDIVNIFYATNEVAKPFEMGASGRVIISSVGASNGSEPILNWQRAGGGGLSATSLIGTAQGAPASLPPGLNVIDGETVIIAEVFYNYSPWIYADLVKDSSIYHSAFFRPRLGSLTEVDP